MLHPSLPLLLLLFPTKNINSDTDTQPNTVSSALNSTINDLPLSYTAPDLGLSYAGDGSWTPTYDPILGGFGYTGLTPQLQSQFFFPGATDLGVWGQDPLMMNSSWLLSPVPLDQPQLGVNNTGLGIDGTIDPIGQSFSNMSLNGSLHNLVPAINPPLVPVTDNIVPVAVLPSPVVPIQPEKPKSWAAIASQPAKPKPPPPKPQTMPTSEAENGKKSHSQLQPSSSSGWSTGSSSGGSASPAASGTGRGKKGGGGKTMGGAGGSNSKLDVVTKLKSENNYNPSEMTLTLSNARFFVIKSYAEDDVHRSIKYNVWCSTEHGNRRLDNAFREQKAKGGVVYLLFSVNGSGHFCGVAQMMSEVELSTDTGIWTQDKWKGRFDLKWIYVKDVPNNQLRHIRLENNENKPVTNSRDTQEVPPEKGKMVIKIIHNYAHTTSIFDDFEHYEKRQEEDAPSVNSTAASSGGTTSKKVFVFIWYL